MREKGIEPPPPQSFIEDGRLRVVVEGWLQRLQASFARIRTYTATLAPASVAADSEATQTFTVSGLTTADIITGNKPTDTAGLSISQVWVSGADTLSIKFRNHTASAIDPPSEDYLLVAIRR